MTNLCYPKGCPGGSQVHGDRVVVGFHNGNVNNNNGDNVARARAVRVPRECQGTKRSDLLGEIYRAYLDARRGKKPSVNKLRFEYRYMDRLLETERRILAGTWQPSTYTAIVATRPKAREILAPDFLDRVVHHWAVSKIESMYEPIFIHDSYANRAGKGHHAAVRRAQQFMRQQPKGWHYQIDIHNFFYSIPRQQLWDLLRNRMERAGLPLQVQKVFHALLRRSAIDSGVVYRSTPEQRALVPRHKQLAYAERGCGIPIGNLPSQFLANVYLNELDQYVKHVLKVPRYIRYVDDIVIFGEDRDQVIAWKQQIEKFLSERLRLRLKKDQKLHQNRDGLDFLGYMIRPTHSLVRRRVVSHAREAFTAWERAHVRRNFLHVTPADLNKVRAVVASYQGHFRHAASFRLRADLHRRFPWMAEATRNKKFNPSADHRQFKIRFSGDMPRGIR